MLATNDKPGSTLAVRSKTVFHRGLIVFALGAILLFLSVQTSRATKPVYRWNMWEDLVSHKGSQYDRGSNIFRIQVISDWSNPCYRDGNNKVRLRTHWLKGEEAFILAHIERVVGVAQRLPEEDQALPGELSP